MHRILMAVLLIVSGAAITGAQEVVRTGDIAKRGLTNADFPRMTKLATNVYAYEQVDPTKRIVTVNNLIVLTADGVVVCDGQGTIDNTKRLVAEIARLRPAGFGGAGPVRPEGFSEAGALPIKYVVVGSEHGDHRGGDGAFPSSVNFVNKPQTITLGGEELQVLDIGRAHTGHDLVTYLPREKILWMSEVFINRIFPSMANSVPSVWLQTLKRAEAMDVAIYVPAHGFIDSPAILNEEERNYRMAIERVIAEGKRLHDAGVPITEAPKVADFGPYADWTRRTENAASALQRVYDELDGKL